MSYGINEPWQLVNLRRPAHTTHCCHRHIPDVVEVIAFFPLCLINVTANARYVASAGMLDDKGDKGVFVLLAGQPKQAHNTHFGL
jgi:hypothetical protein